VGSGPAVKKERRESQKNPGLADPLRIAVVDICKIRLLGQDFAITTCAIIDQNLDFDIMQEPLVLIGFTVTIHQSHLGSAARLVPRPAVPGSCVLYWYDVAIYRDVGFEDFM
jgi:hypothetical protein